MAGETSVRRALPRIVQKVEMFADAIIDDGEECIVVQVIWRWWLHEDGSYRLTAHRADDPLRGAVCGGDDAETFRFIRDRTNAMRSLSCQMLPTLAAFVCVVACTTLRV